MRRFSIVLVASKGLENSSRRELLRQCLESLLAQTYPRELYEVLVVDSGSGIEAGFFERFRTQTDFSLEFINPELGNIGPARGRNVGVRQARFEFVAFTDDDSVVEPDWLEKINASYERHPQATAVGGLTLPPRGVSVSNPWARFEENDYLKYLKGGQLKEYTSTQRDEHPVFSGNISYAKKALLETGLFDESFPAHVSGEDGDLKERVLRSGGQFVFTPVVVWHHCPYSFHRFFRQQLSRGAAILRFRRRHGLETHRVLIILRVFIALLLLPYIWLRENFDFRFAVVSWLSLVIRNLGKIYYYGQT